MHIALSYMVNQSQLVYFVSIRKKKVSLKVAIFYNVALTIQGRTVLHEKIGQLREKSCILFCQTYT